MADAIAVAAHKTRSRAHTDNKHAVETCFEAGAKTVGHELLHLFGGQSIDGVFDISTAHTREHDLLDVAKVNAVIVQISAKSTVKRCHWVGGLDADGRDNLSLLADSNYFRRADADINSYYYSHII